MSRYPRCPSSSPKPPAPSLPQASYFPASSRMARSPLRHPRSHPGQGQFLSSDLSIFLLSGKWFVHLITELCLDVWSIPALFVGLERPEHCLMHWMALSLPSKESLHPNEFTSEVDNKDWLGVTPWGKTGDRRHQRLASAEPSDLGIIRSPWWRRAWRTLGSVLFPQPHSQVGPPFCCIPGNALWSLSLVASSLHRYFKFTILGFKT